MFSSWFVFGFVCTELFCSFLLSLWTAHMLSPISPSSDIYPDGLPSDYSVIATFKVPRDTAKTSWNLWQVSDPEGRDQVGLRFQGDTKTLDFFYTSPRGTQMLRTFQSGGKTLWRWVAQAGIECKRRAGEAAGGLWGGQRGVSGWTTARDPARFYLHRQEGCRWPIGFGEYQGQAWVLYTELSGWVQMFLLFTRHQNIKFCEMQKAMFFRKSTIFNTK